ncbi:helix-turn-helix transcriptional regulator [Ensifer sp. 22460]|uniref:helix-turn-helix transcriptional regulator n=1 Tax=Ensifer sp. 22460 TaxID=3453922 RepID=UPI003F8601ED
MLSAECPIDRGARALLGWSQAERAKAANVSRQTVADFVRGAHVPIRNNLASIVSAFDKAGIEFIPENGGGCPFPRSSSDHVARAGAPGINFCPQSCDRAINFRSLCHQYPRL